MFCPYYEYGVHACHGSEEETCPPEYVHTCPYEPETPESEMFEPEYPPGEMGLY